MSRKLVFRVSEVAGFSPHGSENDYVSRLLIDRESVGSTSLVVNHFTLKPGKSTEPGKHPHPYDEVYYVLRGCGLLQLGSAPEIFALEPDTIAFIPSETLHCLINTGTVDLDLVTVMPQQLVEGANALYDERIRRWGTSFRLASRT